MYVCDRLVEEFMLLANMAVAHQIYRSNPQLALLRRHAPPQSRLMDALQELCDHIGLNIDMSSAGALHVSHTNTCRSTYLTHSPHSGLLLFLLEDKGHANVLIREDYCAMFHTTQLPLSF